MFILEDYYSKFAIEKINNDFLLKSIPNLPEKYCKECGIRLKAFTAKGKTKTYCSNSCSQKSKEVQDKIKKTTIKRYGVTHNAKSQLIKDKKIQTSIKKYGVKHHFQNIDIQNKIKFSNGVDNISQLKATQSTIKKNNLKKYGVTNTSKLCTIKEKVKNTNIKKYGVEYSQKLEYIKDKVRKTNIEKYGVNSFFQTDIAREKRRQVNIKTILDKNKNITVYRKGYKYKCDICGHISTYIKYKNTFLQRLRLGFLPCNKCIPRKTSGSNNRSSYEFRLEKYFNDLGIKTDHKRELDVILVDYNIVIEVNGIYWHSAKYKPMNYHKDKIIKFKNQGIQILGFTDKQLDNDFEKITNYIKGKIGLLPSIGASKCKIREIDTNIAKNFCNTHHIHGYAGGSKKYGLFYKEELLSVCVVGKNRFTKDNSLEIIRLANKCKVIGGMGRFIKKILNDFPSYNKIITFIDVNLGLADKNVFTYNGFNFIEHTKPNYKWILKGKVLSRYQTQKHKLLQMGYSGTENEIMKKLEAVKIYDAGNYKFEYIKKTRN